MKTKAKPKSAKSDQLLQLLLDKLGVEAENTIACAEEQPHLFEKAASYRVDKYRSKLMAKARLEETEARLSLSIRKSARDVGDKITEANLNALVLSENEYQNRLKDLNEAEVEDEYARLMVEAFRMRRDSLDVIKYLASAGLAATRAAEVASQETEALRRKLRAKYRSGEEEE